MDMKFALPVAPCHATGACLAEKSPLTNRIRRQFARIKAVRTGRRRSWLLGKGRSGPNPATSRTTFRTFRCESRNASVTKVRTFRRRKSGHVEDDGQDISKTKVRKRRGRRPG